MDIFKLVGSVFVDTDEANKSLSKTDDKAGGLANTLASTAKSAGKMALGIGTAAAGVATSLIGVASKTAESMDAVDKASQRMGVTAESYQELAHAASLSGVEMSTMEKAAKKLEGTDISFDDAMASIYELETAEERSAKAAELFGESVAYSMGPMLNASAEDMEAMKQEAHDLGLVMDQDTVSAGAQLNDTISNIKDSVTALGTNLGGALLPLVNDAGQMLLEFMPTLQNIVSEIGPVLADTLASLLPVLLQVVQNILPPVLALIEALLPLFTEICNIVLPILSKLLEGLAKVLTNIVIPVITKVVGVVKNAITTVVNGFQRAKEVIVGVFEGIKEAVKKPINFVIGMINKMIDALNALSFDVPDWVPVLGGKTFGFNLKNIPELAEGGTVMTSGRAIVGEAGAELIDLPQGARVTPLTDNGSSVFDYEKMADAVTSALLKVLPELKYSIQPDSNGIFKVVQAESKRQYKMMGGYV